MAMDPKSREAARARREDGAMSALGSVRERTGGRGVDLSLFQDMLRGAQRAEVTEQAREVSPEQIEGIPADSAFASAIPGVESLILNPGTKPGTIDVRARVQTREGVQDVALTCTPKMLTAPFRPFPAEIARLTSPEGLLKEVLDAVEALGHVTWHEIPGDLIAADVGSAGPKEVNFSGPEEPNNREIECPERLKFLAQMNGAVYGFRGRKGFLGYHGIAFDDGVYVIDHPEMGNAAYIGEGLPPFDAEGDEEAQIERGLQEAARLFVGRTRAGLREMGAVPVVHRGNWQERMTAGVERVRAQRVALRQAQ